MNEDEQAEQAAARAMNAQAIITATAEATAAALATQNGAIADAIRVSQKETAKRPKIQLTPFVSGDADDWLTFRRIFVISMTTEEWSDQHAKNMLAAYIRGNAAKVIRHLPPDDVDQTFEQYVRAVEARFVHPAESARARAAYRLAQPKTGEDAQAWATRLEGLYRRAFVGNDPNQDDHLLQLYISRYPQPAVKRKLLETEPGTLGEALIQAQSQEAVEEQMRGTDSALASGALGSLYTSGDQTAGSVPGSIAPKWGNSKRGGRGRGRGRGGAGAGQTRTLGCWHCGADHFRRECPRFQALSDAEKKRSQERSKARAATKPRMVGAAAAVGAVAPTTGLPVTAGAGPAHDELFEHLGDLFAGND
jgi:hypothetical protein